MLRAGSQCDSCEMSRLQRRNGGLPVAGNAGPSAQLELSKAHLDNQGFGRGSVWLVMSVTAGCAMRRSAVMVIEPFHAVPGYFGPT
jgi:hypothetical protein